MSKHPCYFPNIFHTSVSKAEEKGLRMWQEVRVMCSRVNWYSCTYETLERVKQVDS